MGLDPLRGDQAGRGRGDGSRASGFMQDCLSGCGGHVWAQAEWPSVAGGAYGFMQGSLAGGSGNVWTQAVWPTQLTPLCTRPGLTSSHWAEANETN